jgi:hypothetical protein
MIERLGDRNKWYAADLAHACLYGIRANGVHEAIAPPDVMRDLADALGRLGLAQHVEAVVSAALGEVLHAGKERVPS